MSDKSTSEDGRIQRLIDAMLKMNEHIKNETKRKRNERRKHDKKNNN